MSAGAADEPTRSLAVRWRRLKEVFAEALETVESLRPAYLAAACGSDAELRAEVESLLAASPLADTLFAEPAVLPELEDVGEFQGNERFRIEGRIGEGGFGVVYAAFDRAAVERVALKVLRRADPERLLRFKREFRAVADLHHENLLSPRELLFQDGRWLLTMELVEGVNVVDWCRPQGRLRVGRCRRALRELLSGLMFLHGAGYLHRDLKPSNVLVDRDGRALLLDFGLAQALGESARGATAGTRGYLPPEASTPSAIGPAADAFGVGAILYACLTGEAPFASEPFSARSLPEPPSLRDADVPADLEWLCLALLDPRPDRRPGLREAHVRLASREVASGRARKHGARPFVGRQAELQALHEATARSRDALQVVLVRGPSGVGKTALLRRYLEQTRQRSPQAIILRSRCHPRESLPYKALDPAVDGLSGHLSWRPWEHPGLDVSEGAAELAAAFPVLAAGLRRFVAEGAHRLVDEQSARRAAAGALRRILAWFCERQAVILAMEDVQWADADSVVMIERLLQEPRPPRLVLVASVSSDEPAGPLWRALMRADFGLRASVMDLRPLPPAEATELARSLLGSASRGLVARIVRDSEGLPLGIAVLADQPGLRGRRTLEEALHRRVDDLAPGERRLLEVVAFARGPISRDAALRAAGLPEGSRAALHLITLRLLSQRFGSSGPVLDLSHPSLRPLVRGLLPPFRRRAFERGLALSLEASRGADPATLAELFAACGEYELASSHAAAAAERAAATLAFDRAADLYRLALRGAGEEARPDLRLHLAEALANAGRGPEAGAAFIEAARDADPRHAARLQRRAAEQFLQSGHVRQGLDASLRASASAAGGSVAPAPDEQIDLCWSMATGLGFIDPRTAAGFQARHLALTAGGTDLYRTARALALDVAFRAARGVDADELEAAEQRAQQAVEASGSTHLRALLMMARGIAWSVTGRWREAVDACDRAEVVLREHCVGASWELATARNTALACLVWLGRLDEVERRLPGLTLDARARGDVYSATRARLWPTCALLLAADRLVEARETVRDVMKAWTRLGFRQQHFWRLGVEAQIDLYEGRAVAAWRRIERHWAATAASVRWVRYSRVEAHRLRALAALAAAPSLPRRGARLLSVAARSLRAIEAEGCDWADVLAAPLRAELLILRGAAAPAAALLRSSMAAFERLGLDLRAAAVEHRLGLLLDGPEGLRLRESAQARFAARGVRDEARFARIYSPIA